MSQTRVEASAHNYAPIVASLGLLQEEELLAPSPGQVLMRLTAPAACRSHFAYICRVLSLVKHELFHHSSMTRKNCLTAILENGQPEEITSWGRGGTSSPVLSRPGAWLQ